MTAELICDPGISGFSFSATQATCSKGWARIRCINECPGGLAQMVERPLSMREVPGPIPGFSNNFLLF